MSASIPLSAALLFPVTSMLLGFSLAGRGLPRWQGLAIAGGGIGFMSAHALGIAMKVSYPVGAALWAAALVPLGIQTLRDARPRHAVARLDPAIPVAA